MHTRPSSTAVGRYWRPDAARVDRARPPLPAGCEMPPDRLSVGAKRRFVQSDKLHLQCFLVLYDDGWLARARH